ncbi:hypothetical protein SNEBB_008354 [Seison nebaliae]|nr:hypothetical protein SNEBB_008354 [Seison nebaliae]
MKCLSFVSILQSSINNYSNVIKIRHLFVSRLFIRREIHFQTEKMMITPKIRSITSKDKIKEGDSFILISDQIEKLGSLVSGEVEKSITNYNKIDKTFNNKCQLLFAEDLPGNRLIWTPIGTLDSDIDDARRLYEAAIDAVKCAINIGSMKPVIQVLLSDKLKLMYPKWMEVILLGAYHGSYIPIELRDINRKKLDEILLFSQKKDMKDIFKKISSYEEGRCVARDIGGSDPERMAPPKVEEYVRKVFGDKSSSIKLTVKSDVSEFEKSYPLLAAVNRAANAVPRHQGRLMFLEYGNKDTADTSLYLVGKGITYDTGGADVKAGGHMAGMHRDKCGAAAVAGFFRTLDLLKPDNLYVCGSMSMVRNSIGEESYVADEIVTSRAGVRIRIGNTDAEGRMVMSDPLCEMKEKALLSKSKDKHIFTIATLTGHCVVAVGESYTAVMDNGPARLKKMAQQLQSLGDEMAEPIEISTVRREDFQFNKGKSEYEDVLQCNNLPSSQTPRGHQIPAAFMAMASGLDKCGKDSATPIPYTHCDIAGSSGPFPGVPTGHRIILKWEKLSNFKESKHIRYLQSSTKEIQRNNGGIMTTIKCGNLTIIKKIAHDLAPTSWRYDENIQINLEELSKSTSRENTYHYAIHV